MVELSVYKFEESVFVAAENCCIGFIQLVGLQFNFISIKNVELVFLFNFPSFLFYLSIPDKKLWWKASFHCQAQSKISA